MAGWVPAIRRKPRDQWLQMHFAFMSWSYVGLVAAAMAEAETRVPNAPFVGVVVVGSAAVFLIGRILIARARSQYFGQGPDADLVVSERWSRC